MEIVQGDQGVKVAGGKRISLLALRILKVLVACNTTYCGWKLDPRSILQELS